MNLEAHIYDFLKTAATTPKVKVHAPNPGNTFRYRGPDPNIIKEKMRTTDVPKGTGDLGPGRHVPEGHQQGPQQTVDPQRLPDSQPVPQTVPQPNQKHFLTKGRMDSRAAQGGMLAGGGLGAWLGGGWASDWIENNPGTIEAINTYRNWTPEERQQAHGYMRLFENNKEHLAKAQEALKKKDFATLHAMAKELFPQETAAFEGYAKDQAMAGLGEMFDKYKWPVGLGLGGIMLLSLLGRGGGRQQMPQMPQQQQAYYPQQQQYNPSSYWRG